MSGPTSKEVDIEVRTLSEQGFSSRRIVWTLRNKGTHISQSTVIRIIGAKTKKRKSEEEGEPDPVFRRARKARTKENIGKVKKIIRSANPPGQRTIAQRLGVSQKIVNTIIHKDLSATVRRKAKVHALSAAHKANRKKNARKLYEDYLAGGRSEYVVTLDEAYFYLSYCNGVRNFLYAQRGQKVPEEWLAKCHESWPVGFMVVAGITGRGPLPLIKVPKNVKVNAHYYIENVLKPYLEKEVPKLYPGEEANVILHHDKASSHTAKLTKEYLETLRSNGGPNHIRNEDIPTKSPDISPLDFFGFGFLKQRLFHRKATTVSGLWKVLKQEWASVTPEMCRKVFGSWKRRCRAVSKVHGEHIEQTKTIHRRVLRDVN